MSVEIDRLSIDLASIERKTLLAQLREKFDEDIAGAVLEEIEKRAREHGITLRG